MNLEVAERPLSSAHILLTEDCNFRCRYCFVKHNPNRMSWDTLKAGIDWLLDHAGPKFNICWFGGEPLLEWDNLVRGTVYAKEQGQSRGIKVSCGAVINGSLVTPERAAKLAELDVSLLYSYDGPHVQEVLRGGRVKQIEENLKLCLDAGIRLSVAMQVAAGHTGHIAEDFIRVEGLGVKAIAVNPVTHCWPAHSEDDWANIERAWDRLSDYEFGKMMSGGRCSYSQLHNQLESILRAAKGQDPKGKRIDYACGACKGSMAIDPEGNIMPCQQMTCAGGWERWKLGNVLTGEYHPEVRDVFVSQAADAWADCKECGVIRCAPCRTINHGVNGDELERAEGTCRWQRTLFEAAIRLHNRLADAGYYSRQSRQFRRSES